MTTHLSTMVILILYSWSKSTDLRVLVLIREQLRYSNVLLAKRPDGGQPLKCHGDMGVERTSSCMHKLGYPLNPREKGTVFTDGFKPLYISCRL